MDWGGGTEPCCAACMQPFVKDIEISVDGIVMAIIAGLQLPSRDLKAKKKGKAVALKTLGPCLHANFHKAWSRMGWPSRQMADR